MTEDLFDGLDLLYLARMDYAKTGLAWQAFLSEDQLLPAVRHFYERRYALEDITAIDAKEGFVGVWRFDRLDVSERVALRVIAPHDQPKFPSIASIFQGAEWHERETTDMYGVTFEGNPNPIPLLLPDDMTLHPLAKAESARVSLADIIAPGEKLRAAPEFVFFPEPTEAG